MKAIRTIIVLGALLLGPLARASEMTVDNLTVTTNADIYGEMNFYTLDVMTGTVTATGGTITESGGYRYHTFTADGTFNVISGSLTCEVLVVAGGGGGARGNDGIAGGGGAGGVLYTNGIILSGSFPVNVGQGGAGGTVAVTPFGGFNGSNSLFAGLTAIGGGHGSKYGSHAINAGDGGSGGGGCWQQNSPTFHFPEVPGTGFAGQGHDGGAGYLVGSNWPGGGGGGAGTVGGDGTRTAGGNGGEGIEYAQFASVGGSPFGWFGGGGGAGAYNRSTDTPGAGGKGGGGAGSKTGNGANGEPNTGGGGGSSGYASAVGDVNAPNNGGNGGSGIVIVRYPITGDVALIPTLIPALTLSSNGISQVSTSAVNSFMGKVGIGTESPEEKLHVSGNVRIDGSLTFGGETRTNWPSGGGVAEGALMVSSNLADLADAAVARTNLGLGTAATNDASAFDAAGTAAAVSSALATHTGDFSNPHQVTAAQVGALSVANNLSDVGNVATVRANLGLGSAATRNAEDFLTPTGDGSQLTGITAGQVAGTLISSNNLSDVADVTTARNNLGALSAAGGVVNGSLDLTGSIAAGIPGGDIPMGVYTNQ